jgi:hypothetical protein
VSPIEISHANLLHYTKQLQNSPSPLQTARHPNLTQILSPPFRGGSKWVHLQWQNTRQINYRDPIVCLQWLSSLNTYKWFPLSEMSPWMSTLTGNRRTGEGVGKWGGRRDDWRIERGEWYWVPGSGNRRSYNWRFDFMVKCAKRDDRLRQRCGRRRVRQQVATWERPRSLGTAFSAEMGWWGAAVWTEGQLAGKCGIWSWKTPDFGPKRLPPMWIGSKLEHRSKAHGKLNHNFWLTQN